MACVIIQIGFKCNQCGSTNYQVQSLSIPKIVKKQKAFSELHKDCKAKEEKTTKPITDNQSTKP
jgi:hypothetical protein